MRSVDQSGDRKMMNINKNKLFLHKYVLNICCGYSLESSHWDDYNEYTQHMFLWRNNNKKLSLNYYQLPSLSVLLQKKLAIFAGACNTIHMNLKVEDTWLGRHTKLQKGGAQNKNVRDHSPCFTLMSNLFYPGKILTFVYTMSCIYKY